MEILELELETGCLEETKAFYTKVLTLKLVEEAEGSFTVAAGASRLRFIRGAGQPFYHFAFNIPENKIAKAKLWLEDRVDLIEDEGDALVFFPHWNAHSLYFRDPSGNIVEMIARHNLANRSEGAFASDDIRCVSEIGLPVEDVMDTVEKLQVVHGLSTWREPSSQFAPVGDENGLLIVVSTGRIWFMSDNPAAIFPLKVKMKGNKPITTKFANYTLEVAEYRLLG